MQPDPERHEPPPRGAYGLRITGIPEAEGFLSRADTAWPRLEVSARRGPVEGVVEQVTDERATAVLLGAVVTVERATGKAVFTFADDPDPTAIVHPYLAPVAALVSHWHGREPLHAGAFVIGGGAWGLLAERQGGKSSTLAHLALAGVPIVTDDMLVLAGETAFPGPRALDLREEPARMLGVGEPLGMVGARNRWRMQLDDSGRELPLRGWVFLEWADDVELARISAGERLKGLAEQRSIRLSPVDPTMLLRLAALPAYVLRRPRKWESLERATALLTDALA